MLLYVFGGLLALAILLITAGLTSQSPVDPVQARLTQLGSVQAKNLEELELQQPFLERTLRPLVARLSTIPQRITSAASAEASERRLALAGNPGDLRVADWLGVKMLSLVAFGVILFLFAMMMSGGNIMGGLLFGGIGSLIGYMFPEFWLGRRIKGRQAVILKSI